MMKALLLLLKNLIKKDKYRVYCMYLALVSDIAASSKQFLYATKKRDEQINMHEANIKLFYKNMSLRYLASNYLTTTSSFNPLNLNQPHNSHYDQLTLISKILPSHPFVHSKHDNDFFSSIKCINHGVGAAIAALCASANHDPAATEPPYTVDWITAANDPATGPVTAKPIIPKRVTPSQASTPICFVINQYKEDEPGCIQTKSRSQFLLVSDHFENKLSLNATCSGTITLVELDIFCESLT